MNKKLPILNFYIEKCHRRPHTIQEIKFWMTVSPRLKLELLRSYAKFLEKYHPKKKKPR